MTKRDVLRYIALGVALLTAIATAWYLLFVPYTLRTAVAPAGGEAAQFLTALAGMLETRSNGNIRNRDDTLAGAHLGRTFTLLIP